MRTHVVCWNEKPRNGTRRPIPPEYEYPDKDSCSPKRCKVRRRGESCEALDFGRIHIYDVGCSEMGKICSNFDHVVLLEWGDTSIDETKRILERYILPGKVFLPHTVRVDKRQYAVLFPRYSRSAIARLYPSDPFVGRDTYSEPPPGDWHLKVRERIYEDWLRRDSLLKKGFTLSEIIQMERAGYPWGTPHFRGQSGV